jgi:hypothetical protein
LGNIHFNKYDQFQKENQLFKAIKRAGNNLTPDGLKTALESLRNFESGGVFPPVTYSNKNHEPVEMVKFFKADVENKRLVPISDWRKPKKM